MSNLQHVISKMNVFYANSIGQLLKIKYLIALVLSFLGLNAKMYSQELEGLIEDDQTHETLLGAHIWWASLPVYRPRL